MDVTLVLKFRRLTIVTKKVNTLGPEKSEYIQLFTHAHSSIEAISPQPSYLAHDLTSSKLQVYHHFIFDIQ